MINNIKIIVTDVPPLVALAVAKSLDYLLYPGPPVIVPDAGFHETTTAIHKMGVQKIIG